MCLYRRAHCETVWRLTAAQFLVLVPQLLVHSKLHHAPYVAAQSCGKKYLIAVPIGTHARIFAAS